jgi:hypothetical protein
VSPPLFFKLGELLRNLVAATAELFRLRRQSARRLVERGETLEVQAAGLALPRVLHPALFEHGLERPGIVAQKFKIEHALNLAN